MKRITIALLCIWMALSVLPGTVWAQEEQTLEDVILESCTYNLEADISEYGVTLEELEKVFFSMLNRGDLPWYVDRTYFLYEENLITGKVKMFQPRLIPDYKYNRAFYQQRLEEILQECVLEGMTDWQIALSIHDYLVVHGYYDESLNERSGYDLLKNGRTVCTGYTEVYKQLLNMAGIPCVNVVSEAMLHTWNLVQIGGNWYHVDVTWDDPTPDCSGRVMHEYFLVSDEEISSGEEPHHGWETDIQCTDDSYSTAFWKKISNPIVFTDANTCYLIRDKKFSNAIYRRDLSTGEETQIYKEKNTYLNIGKGSYRYAHYGLSIWNGKLWMGTMTQVLSMTMDGEDVQTEFTYEAKQNKRFLAGFYVDKDYIRYTTREHNGNENIYIQTLAPTGYHVHKYTETMVEPSCGVAGYTESQCSCGIICQSSPLYPLEHEFTKTRIAPTTEKEGAIVERCANCGEEHTKVIPKLPPEEPESGGGTGWIIGGAAGGVAIVIAVAVIGIRKRADRKKKAVTEESLDESAECTF